MTTFRRTDAERAAHESYVANLPRISIEEEARIDRETGAYNMQCRRDAWRRLAAELSEKGNIAGAKVATERASGPAGRLSVPVGFG